jgi:hypothetical protein
MAVLALGASLAALWLAERAQVADDLQLFAEDEARPSDTLALRALWLRDVDAPEGPSLGEGEVLVRLLDPGRRELARTTLTPSALASMQGQIRVPSPSRGTHRLEATLRTSSGMDLRTVRELELFSDAPGRKPLPRMAGPLQHYALGRVRTLGVEPAPGMFLPRVLGGSCLPELPCTLLVWVGEPAAALEVVPSAAVEPKGAPSPAAETSGLVRIDVIVHGAEAELTLRALRGGKVVAERGLRLPVGLGEAGVVVEKSVLDAREPIEVQLSPPPGRRELIVDTFLEGRWADTRGFATLPGDGRVRLAEASGASGLVRLQARADAFSADGAGTRVLYVRGEGESDGAVLSAVEALAQRAAPEQRLVSELPPDAAFDLQRWAAFLLAPLEATRMSLPLAASGRPLQLARLDRLKSLLRFGVGAVLLLAAFVVGATLLRRGLSATDEASAILEQEAEAGQAPHGALRGDRVQVVVLVTAVCMAFLAAALLIVAKPLWF